MTLLDNKGFRKKTYAEIWDEVEGDAKKSFGEKINTGPRSIIGILLRVFAWPISVLWNVAEAVYLNSFPSTATGISLDRTVKFKGMSRMLAQESFGEVEITGTPEAIIPSGLRISTRSDIEFETIDDVELDSNGKGLAEIRAIELGTRGNVEAESITEIVEPQENVGGVINPNPTNGGREKETDAELLSRFEELTESGSSSAESIQATLIELDGVRDAIVDENTSMNENDDGVPPKSIAPFVFGGTGESVANAILDVKPGGIQSYGEDIYELDDSQGVTHLIGFTRPSEISVYVDVQLTTNEYFPSDGNEQVQTSVVEYIGGTDEGGREYNGLGLDDDVIHGKLITSVFSVEGVEDAVVQIGISDTELSENNISVSTTEVAKTSYDKVVIS